MVFPSEGDKCLGECFGSNNPPITIFQSRTESPSNLRSQRPIIKTFLPSFSTSRVSSLVETLLYFWILFFVEFALRLFADL